MKKLPIGIQTIETLLEEGYVYVDKTKLIHQLISTGKYYFYTRPRRFGKSLLISTLKAIFKGKKDLFKECSIFSLPFSWTKHPVIHLDFTQIVTRDSEELKGDLLRFFEATATEYNKIIEMPNLKGTFINLVKALAADGKVVFLVDEYDKPIVDNLDQMDVAEANREIVRDLFGAVKGLDPYLQFVFVTGVSKFSQVSLFSDFNNVQDITILPDYAALSGYTEQEILQSFSEHLKDISSSSGNLIQEMREWYNGYRFSVNQQAVYNPHSTLNFLYQKTFHCFWFRTGTPTFLIKLLKEAPQLLSTLSGIMATQRELLDIHDPRKMNVKALMWQTGYLTFQRFDASTNLFQLDFPNKEVRDAFFDSLIQDFAELDSAKVSLSSREARKALDKGFIDSFFSLINVYFAGIPYNLFTNANESFYHAIFITLLEAMGIKVHPEQKTSLGSIDLVVEREQFIYIFEFKLDKHGDQALQQILDKKYAKKYGEQGKAILLIGAIFSSKTRNISEWKIVKVEQKL